MRRSERRAPRRGGARAAGLALALALEPAGAGQPAPAAALLPAGEYRLEMELVSRVTLPVIGEVDSSLRSVSAAVLRWRDGVLHQAHRVCALWDATRAPWGGVRFPPAFVAALAPARYPVELDGAGAGARYRADLGVEAIGVAPRAAALPTRPGAPGVLDFDGDGRPGGTLRLRIPLVPDGELWVVQRAHAVLDGELVERGIVEGVVEMARFEQAVIGARPPFLRRTPRTRHDAARSRFRLEHAGAAPACPPPTAAAADPAP